MKQLTCEMCGGTDLVKQDGMYVRQTCGTKYSAEEAKKMMIEGKVDVSGSSIKVDVSDELTKLSILAHRAKDDGDFERMYKYYEQINEKNPDDWESYFNLSFAKAMNNNFDDIYNICVKFERSTFEALDLLKKSKKDDNYIANSLKEISSSCILFVNNYYGNILLNNFKSKGKSLGKQLIGQATGGVSTAIDLSGKLIKSTKGFLDKKMKNAFGVAEKETKIYSVYDRLFKQIEFIYGVGNKIKDLFGDIENVKPYIVTLYKFGIEKDNQLPIDETSCNGKKKSEIKELHELREIRKEEYINLIKTIEPDYICEEKKGCYVATCVYGSYDCPEVWVLRRYRDNVLSLTWYGRLFVSIYYFVSPTIVKWFGSVDVFKSICKSKLDKMVTELKEKGFKDTKYYD